MHDKVFSADGWERLLDPNRKSTMSVEQFFDISKPQKTETWLDLGCGPGYFTIPIAARVSKIYALDISKEMLDICQNRATEHKLQNITYIESASSEIDINSESLDKALLANVYHEFDSHQDVVKELFRLTKSTGKVYVVDWRYEQMEQGPPLDHRIPENQVVEIFENSGFQFIGQHDLYEKYYTLEFLKS